MAIITIIINPLQSLSCSDSSRFTKDGTDLPYISDRFVTPHVIVSSGFHNRLPDWVASTTEVGFPQFWRLGSPRAQCWLLQVLVRTLLGMQRATFSPCPPCVLTWQRSSSGLFLLRTPLLLGQHATLTTSFNFNYL